MKYAIDCRSILLQKGLTLLLKEKLVSLSECDAVIVDYEAKHCKPILRIEPHGVIPFPFTSSSLSFSLKRWEETFSSKQCLCEINTPNDPLEEKIDEIVRRFSSELVSVIKNYYAK